MILECPKDECGVATNVVDECPLGECCRATSESQAVKSVQCEALFRFAVGGRDALKFESSFLI